MKDYVSPAVSVGGSGEGDVAAVALAAGAAGLAAGAAGLAAGACSIASSRFAIFGLAPSSSCLKWVLSAICAGYQGDPITSLGV